jgi:hypothetical protein
MGGDAIPPPTWVPSEQVIITRIVQELVNRLLSPQWNNGNSTNNGISTVNNLVQTGQYKSKAALLSTLGYNNLLEINTGQPSMRIRFTGSTYRDSDARYNLLDIDPNLNNLTGAHALTRNDIIIASAYEIVLNRYIRRIVRDLMISEYYNTPRNIFLIGNSLNFQTDAASIFDFISIVLGHELVHWGNASTGDHSVGGWTQFLGMVPELGSQWERDSFVLITEWFPYTITNGTNPTLDGGRAIFATHVRDLPNCYPNIIAPTNSTQKRNYTDSELNTLTNNLFQ